MSQSPRNPQTLYAAVILAAMVAVIVVARRQQGTPLSPSPRAVPKLSPLRRIPAGELAWQLREPRTLLTPEAVSKVPAASATAGREVRAGYPADESDDIGPVTQEEASVYEQGAETASSQIPGIRRLAPVESEEADVSTQSRPAESTIASRPPGTGHNEALRPVLQQAAQLNRQAESLARRGAYYLARNLTIQSLRMIAETLDLQSGSGEHTAALASALTALREAADFQSRSSEDSTMNVPLVVAGHRTPVLRKQNTEGLSAIAAQQQYYNFAGQQLVIAAGGQAVASHSLCNMGKLQSRMNEGTTPQQTNLARAMVYQQAALAVDRRNYLAANELGNILATFGQLQEARRVLVHSVGTVASPEGWQSLASVHERLGETDLAANARKQMEALTGGGGGPRPKVEWVSPEVFAGNQPASAVKTVSAIKSEKSEVCTAAPRPKQKETWISPFGIKR